jgi:group I intron endonuclease
MNCGVYKYQNKIDVKLYIGSSIDIQKRWKSHRDELIKNNHENCYLQRAITKYGIENFEFRVLEIVEDKTKLIEREQYYLDLYKSYLPKNGYNICKVAGLGSQLGLTRSDSSKQLMSLAKKGKPGNLNAVEAMRKVNLGNKYTLGRIRPQIEIDAVRKANTGRKRTGIVLENIRKANQKVKESGILKGSTPTNKGTKYFLKPRETRICVCGCNQEFKVIVTSKKRYFNGGHCHKGKIGPNKGKTFSTEVRQKFSKSHLGIPQSNETVYKRSLAMKGKNLGNKNGIGNKGPKGRIPWNKGLTKETDCRISGPNKRF